MMDDKLKNLGKADKSDKSKRENKADTCTGHRKLMMTIDHQPVTSALSPAMCHAAQKQKPLRKTKDKKQIVVVTGRTSFFVACCINLLPLVFGKNSINQQTG